MQPTRLYEPNLVYLPALRASITKPVYELPLVYEPYKFTRLVCALE